MEDNIKCDKCNIGNIKVEKICKLRWKVTCNYCKNLLILEYPQLLAYLKILTTGAYK